MKRIAVVANQKEYAEELANNLRDYFREQIEINPYDRNEVLAMESIEEEFVGATFTIFQEAKKKIRKTSELIVFQLALTRKNVEKLQEVPGNTRALLVNLDHRACMQVITNIYGMGYRDIELVPYYGVGDYDHDIKLAITLDEQTLVPKGIERVVNLGHREIDLDCILDLADRLELKEWLLASEQFQQKKSMFFGSSGIEKALGENLELSCRIDTLIQLMEPGIVIANSSGRIHLYNQKAVELLERRGGLESGFYVMDLLPELDLGNWVGKKQLVTEEDGNLMISVRPIEVENKISGYIVSINKFEEVEENQHGVRTRLSRGDHTAKYHFSDIRGESPEIREAIRTAQRMARSDSSILITGESGTGKEVFAQSIHNASGRSGYHFVAVNCAAIPENLLESEMFGYEEGSFTGARRGGKIGYFELAHKGTIFLDEIAELPLLLQAKLLRVIEEREIIKIGARKVIQVDVRIIAATNRDLRRHVEEGRFREDLYYRLNVLPLSIPSIRERKGDIRVLAEYFMEALHCSFRFSPEAQECFRNYEWKGNVRELRNVVEYLSNLEKDLVEPGDLPQDMKRGMELADQTMLAGQGGSEGLTDSEGLRGSGIAVQRNAEGLEQAALLGRLFSRDRGKLEIYQFILEELERAADQGIRIGRTRLWELSKQRRLYFTEPEIRAALTRLNDCGFVRTGRGRGGSVITAAGIQLSQAIKIANW